MAEMQDYDLSNPRDKQAFQRFMIELMRNEINSYTKQTENNNPNPAASLATGLLPSGVIVPFAGGPGALPAGTAQSIPVGWLLCDASAVSRNAYSALFAAIGTTYGVGDGSTTFGLPDLRGRTIAGKDNMGGTPQNRLTTAGSGVDGVTLGANGGTQTHALTEAQLASHTHTQNPHSHTFTPSAAAGYSSGALGNVMAAGSAYWVARSGANVNDITSVSGTTNTTATNQNAGSGTAHQNTQPTIITNYIIKT
jgi:microcystin-dependent protein